MPRQIERVDAIEQTEVVRLAPHDLLLAHAQAERDVGEVDVDVRLAQVVLVLERVARAGRDVAELTEPLRR